MENSHEYQQSAVGHSPRKPPTRLAVVQSDPAPADVHEAIHRYDNDPYICDILREAWFKGFFWGSVFGLILFVLTFIAFATGRGL